MAPTTKGSRTTVKGHITKTINLINGLKTVMTQEELNNLEILETKLIGYYETYKGFLNTIQDELNDADADQAEYDAETDITYQTQDDVLNANAVIKLKRREWLNMLKKKEKEEEERKQEQKEEERDKRILALIQQQVMNQATTTRDIITQVIAAIPTPQAPVVNVTTAAPSQSTHSMRLPQRQIKHFKGDILEWTQFWESFNAAIHSSTLTNVQKFDYLKEYLKGEANLIVNNLELTDANYQVAIDELTRRYGKKQVMIDAHFNKLHTLQPVKDGNDVQALRSLQLNLQWHISALETLGIPTTSFGGLLGTQLIKLIPSSLHSSS
ncbi:hypothetical protein GHT06_017056 [Daphnia sinensis]|uniref:Uncharacterized protein n=1 Tax=Daphnia sinensis TaxID=1820382 RepID=A0AAD5PTI1_9CRUS|nr:hypothetical protein GHT06_017056 [Daphnia sinensis]